jgi:hypothetical protein
LRVPIGFVGVIGGEGKIRGVVRFVSVGVTGVIGSAGGGSVEAAEAGNRALPVVSSGDGGIVERWRIGFWEAVRGGVACIFEFCCCTLSEVENERRRRKVF